MGIFYPEGREGVKGLKIKEFTIDIWNYLDVGAINDALDEAIRGTNFVAEDIDYECLSVTSLGEMKLKATYFKHEKS